MNTTKWGVEIECGVNDRDELERDIQDMRNAPVVETDGSVNVDDDNVEVITPPLTIAEGGFEYIRMVCSLIQDHNPEVNRTCGLHVHIDGSGMPLSHIKHLWAFYVAFENVLESFVPRSRRRNSFARSFRSSVSVDEILKNERMISLEKAWYKAKTTRQVNMNKTEKYHNSRYFYLNLHSYFKDGHYEIRSHSGTVNPEKIILWVQLHLAIRSLIQRRGYSLPNLRQICDIGELSAQTEIFFRTLKLEDRVKEYFLERQSMFASVTTPFTVSQSSQILLADEVAA